MQPADDALTRDVSCYKLSVVFTLCFTLLESFLKETLHYKWTNAQREDATVRKRRSGETYRLGGFDEDLGAAELELILVHVDRP